MEALLISKRVFAEHAYDLCNRPGYYKSTWQLFSKTEPIKGVYGHFMDPKGRVIVIKMLFNEGYPENPPIVMTTPPIRDVCFDNQGILNFASRKGLFVWKKYKRYSNPLVYLADELANKYNTI